MLNPYRTRRVLYRTIFHLLIFLLGFLMVYPVLWMVFGSFKTNYEILNESLKLLPKVFSVDNYIRGWRGFGNLTFAQFFLNSFIITTLATAGVTISSSLVAYAFARIRFPGRKFLFACMMATMMLPAQVVMIPQYIIFRNLDLTNTFVPLILPSWFSSAFFVFLMMQFIQGLPKELDEAAILDGCSRYSVYTRIIMPLISPALITTFIINFYWKWDDFMGPLIYLSRPKMFPVSLAIKLFADSSSETDFGAMFAMSTLSLLPVFFIFLFFNKYLVEGISTSGLKG
ncbi:carbohydrate ABC transporter membrane protein 2 (CUT1 family) [Hydrogenispora ethanolica]|jgi:multiple sugar transport system permease protein|uniref:Carbohydrate ABC transporter membrane protein 2 (CUT1 family) n=1 Tax=Hydrogenispora ethanolica TaxID=1082276 RepID=A0A4R1R315_HYDET|nr:carbohydrate ABC transporter permease [Hydrogenispora ethanolica]TCL59785.1 carbohydrate ABC transporter membrane protein 2 (CUT1 family) [Hydrogenispora ethanolica]